MNVAIIAAAGFGTRMGGQGKQYLSLRDEPIMAHTLRAFQNCTQIQKIIIVTNEAELVRCRSLVKSYRFDKVARIVKGGSERQDSVYNGLKVLPEQVKIVAVHDGARPLVTPDLIETSLTGLKDWDGVVAGIPAKDTLKRIKGEQVEETLDRRSIWHIQTPQIFRADLLFEAYQKAGDEDFRGTDDAVLMERMGCRIGIVMGSYENLKITTPEDLVIAEAILARRAKMPTSDERRAKSD